MNTAIGWAITAYTDAGEWLLLPAGIAAGWAAYRLVTRAVRRARARAAEATARPSTDPLEQAYAAPAIKHRHRNTNTRKENRP